MPNVYDNFSKSIKNNCMDDWKKCNFQILVWDHYFNAPEKKSIIEVKMNKREWNYLKHSKIHYQFQSIDI